jgi:DNA-binding protein HU-beta
MNKKDLVQVVSSKTYMTKKEIDLVLSAALEIIMEAVSSGERVKLIGFGSFFSSKRKLPSKINIHDLFLDVGISFVHTVRFSPGKFFKQKINLPR